MSTQSHALSRGRLPLVRVRFYERRGWGTEDCFDSWEFKVSCVLRIQMPG